MPAGAELLVQDLLDRLGALQRNNNERVCCSIVAEMLVSGVSAILFKTILRQYAKWAGSRHEIGMPIDWAFSVITNFRVGLRLKL